MKSLSYAAGWPRTILPLGGSSVTRQGGGSARFHPSSHHRHSIRLKDYDYSQAGAYFVTICAWQRECLFGGIVNGEMVLNDMGQIVKSVWCQLPEYFPNINLDAYVIMPNHFHGILQIPEF